MSNGPIFSAFAKFWRGATPDQLATLARETGLDGIDLLVRPGFCEPAQIRDFVAAFRRANLSVPLAILDQGAAELAKNSDNLARFSDAGIPFVRIGYFGRTPQPSAALAQARTDLEVLVPILQRLRLRALLQLHHGTLLTSATAAWTVVRDLPVSAVGVQLDPGNQAYEGHEAYDYAVPLLGDYLASIGVKDAAPQPPSAAEPEKGWTRPWAPLGSGISNWTDLATALRAVNFSGLFNFQPFYHQKDETLRTQTLKNEVAWLRGLLTQKAAK